MKIYDLKYEKETWTFKGHETEGFGLDIHDGKIVSGSSDKTVKVWRVDEIGIKDKCFLDLKFHTEEVLDVSISRLSGLVASASDDKRAAIWDLRAPQNPSIVLQAS